MFTKPEGRDEWKLLGLWILAGFGYSALTLLTFRVNSTYSLSVFVYPILQWLVLRSFLPRASSWLKGTIVGYLFCILGIGIPVAIIAVVSLLVDSQHRLLQSFSQVLTPTNGILTIQQETVVVILLVVSSGLVASGQALTLRQYVRKPRGWVVATVIASAVGGSLLIALRIVVALGPSATPWQNLGETLIDSVITGIVLVAMLRDRVPVASPPE